MVDWQARSAASFGLAKFADEPWEIASGIKEVLNLIFNRYKLNRIEWFAYMDNPAFNKYKHFVEAYGGSIYGPLHQCSLLEDGELHDACIFELMREDYLKARGRNK